VFVGGGGGRGRGGLCGEGIGERKEGCRLYTGDACWKLAAAQALTIYPALDGLATNQLATSSGLR